MNSHIFLVTVGRRGVIVDTYAIVGMFSVEQVDFPSHYFAAGVFNSLSPSYHNTQFRPRTNFTQCIGALLEVGFIPVK